MRRALSPRVIALLAVALLAVGCDWAQFGSDAGRSGFNPGESSLGASVIPDLVRRWAQPVGYSNLGDPVVVGNTVYLLGSTSNGTGTAACLEKLDARTGRLTQTWPALGTGGADVPSRPRLAVGDGAVYWMYWSGYGDLLMASDPSTGEQRWRNTDASGSAVVTVDGNDVILSDPPILGASDQRGLYVFAGDTGSTLWTLPLNTTVMARPAVADGTIFAVVISAAGSQLEARAEATGALKWARPTSGAYDVAVVAEGKVVVSSVGGLFAYDAATGRLLWSRTDLVPMQDDPSVANGSVYVAQASPNTSTPSLVDLDLGTGASRWATPLPVASRSKPAVANGVVYIGGTDGTLYALDAGSGAVLTRLRTGGSVVSSPVVAQGQVYVLDDSGTLSDFGPPPAGTTASTAARLSSR
jgi:outer membrane protein assembly factor BamB